MRQGLAVLGIVLLLCGTARAQDVGPISHDCVVDGPLEQVWAAFTTTDGLRAWLAPHVREVSMGFSTDPESQKMRGFFNQGNATTLSQLQRHFAARKK